MILSRRARDRKLALIDKECRSKSTVYDPHYRSVMDEGTVIYKIKRLPTKHYYAGDIDDASAKVQHIKMRVTPVHEPRMLTDLSTGLHPRIGEPYRRFKMIEEKDLNLDDKLTLFETLRAKHNAKTSENPCCEVELPDASHPAIEMKMPDYEDMIRHYQQVYEISA